MAPMIWLMLLVSLPAAAQADFPGFTTTKAQGAFAGIAPVAIGNTPLSSAPSILALDHLDAAQMGDADHQVVSNLSAELSKQAALADFDISQPAWHYEQIVCPAFPDYVFLSFSHGADDAGSSHFTAMLPRSDAQVRLVSTYAHGVLPFEGSWNRPSTFEVFNGVLRQQRGLDPIGQAHNWLMIALCYAELCGYAAQVLTYTPTPELTLDLLRLDANQPQITIATDQSAEITFSDVSRPASTTNWTLHFDRHGQITSAAHTLARQPPAIALKP